MAFIPIIVPNKRNSSRSRSESSITAVVLACVIFGLLFFLMFGLFDLNRFSFPPFIFLSGFIVFIIIIIGISAISMSMSETYKKSKEEVIKPYGFQQHSNSQPQEQTHQYNPYIIRKSIHNEPEELTYNQVKPEEPVLSTINYCRFCGIKIDMDAIYCHQCGINLSS